MEIKLARYKQSQLVKFKPSRWDGYKNGFDNLFPNYLDSLYNASPTHAAIINDLTSYIVGSGLKSRNPQQNAILENFFPKKKLKKVVLADVIHNVKQFEVLKSLNKITELNFIQPAQTRVLKIEYGEPVLFKYRQTFNSSDMGYKVEKDYVAYNPDEEQDESLFYVYDSGTFNVPYGRPYYMNGLNAIELEAGLYLAQNHGVMNGMFPNAIITMETTGDDKKDRQQSNAITNSASGPANFGKTITIHTPVGATNPPQIVFPSVEGMDRVAEQHYKSAEAGITKAHSLPSQSLIAGLNIKPSGFSSVDEEMQWSMNQWMSKKIEPYREDFIEDLEPIWKDLEIDPKLLYFEDQENDNKKIEVKMKSDIKVIDEKDESKLLDYLSKNADNEKDLLDLGFELVQEDELDGDDELQLKAERLTKFNDISPWGLTPDNLSRYDVKDPSGEGVWLVRYQYSLASRFSGQPPIIETSRNFCKDMIDYAQNGNRVYKREVLDNLKNPEFGSYNIFWHKGSYNCRHVWKRKLYYKSKDGSVRPVGNVPYVTAKLNDKRATSANRRVR